MKQSDLNEILEKHKRWINNEEGGEPANLQGADLRNTILRDSDLRSADLDYSCFPLWCGSEGIKLDRRLFLQLIAHICAVEVDDEECKKTQEYLMPLAKQSHVAKWLFGEWKERVK